MSPCLPVLLSLVMLGCAPQTVIQSVYPDVAPGRYEKSLESEGYRRTYILRVPKGYDRTKATPLLVGLHGYTGSGSLFERSSGLADAAEKEGWLAVFPDGLGERRGWNAGFINLTGKKVDDAAFIGKLLDEVAKEVNVDAKRVYVAGHSNGAMMAHLLAAKMPERITAIGAVAGLVGLSTATMVPKPATSVSVIMIHGKLDQVVGYDSGGSALLRGIPAPRGAQWWAEQIGAMDKPTVTEEGGVKTEVWKSGRGGAEVRLVTIAEGRHDWPKTATPLIMDLFRSSKKG